MGQQVTSAVVTWIETGALVPLVGLWVVLAVCDRLLQKTFRYAIHGEFTHGTPFSARHVRWLRLMALQTVVCSVMPAFEQRDSIRYQVTGGASHVFPQVAIADAAGTLMEEFFFRGLPLILARATGVDAVWLVGIGTGR